MSQDSNEQTLAELRRIRVALYFLIAVLVLGLLSAFVRGFSHGLSQGTSEASPSWDRVRTAMSEQDFHAALPLAKALVERQPNYYYGQGYLATIYLALGDVTNAESCYARAYQLFPNEEGEKDLAAVRKRLGEQEGVNLLSK